MSIGSIGIGGAGVFASLVEEIELYGAFMTVFIAFSTDEPVVCSLGFSCHGDIVAGLCFKVFGVVPVACHVANELEGIVEAFVVFRQVGSHLQRTVHREIECELSAERRPHP